MILQIRQDRRYREDDETETFILTFNSLLVKLRDLVIKILGKQRLLCNNVIFSTNSTTYECVKGRTRYRKDDEIKVTKYVDYKTENNYLKF